jgi:hypothetical protein
MPAAYSIPRATGRHPRRNDASGRATNAVHPFRDVRRLVGMPTPEVLSLIAAVVLWIGLLATIAPEV